MVKMLFIVGFSCVFLLEKNRCLIFVGCVGHVFSFFFKKNIETSFLEQMNQIYIIWCFSTDTYINMLFIHISSLYSVIFVICFFFFLCMKPQGQKTSEMLLLCIYIIFLPGLRILFLPKRFNCKNDLFGLVAATIISNNKFPKPYKSSKHFDKLSV